MRAERILEALRGTPLSVHPVDVGLRTEAAVVAELLRRGVRVLQPRGVNQRYDLVLDLFLVHCAQNAGIYAVPVDQAPRGEMRLRVTATATVRRPESGGRRSTPCPRSSTGRALHL